MIPALVVVMVLVWAVPVAVVFVVVAWLILLPSCLLCPRIIIGNLIIAPIRIIHHIHLHLYVHAHLHAHVHVHLYVHVHVAINNISHVVSVTALLGCTSGPPPIAIGASLLHPPTSPPHPHPHPHLHPVRCMCSLVGSLVLIVHSCPGTHSWRHVPIKLVVAVVAVVVMFSSVFPDFPPAVVVLIASAHWLSLVLFWIDLLWVGWWSVVEQPWGLDGLSTYHLLLF